MYVVFVIRLSIYKKNFLEKIDFLGETFSLAFSQKPTPFLSQESFYSKWDKIY